VAATDPCRRRAGAYQGRQAPEGKSFSQDIQLNSNPGQTQKSETGRPGTRIRPGKVLGQPYGKRQTELGALTTPGRETRAGRDTAVRRLGVGLSPNEKDRAMKIGVLALQGDFDAHRRRLQELGAEVVLIKKPNSSTTSTASSSPAASPAHS